MTKVLMQFGDSTQKELEMNATDAETAVEEAKDWVSDNAWFEVQDSQGNVIAETRF